MIQKQTLPLAVELLIEIFDRDAIISPSRARHDFDNSHNIFFDKILDRISLRPRGACLITSLTKDLFRLTQK